MESTYSEYIRDQMNRISTVDQIKIKLIDSDGGETNFINITLQEFLNIYLLLTRDHR